MTQLGCWHCTCVLVHVQLKSLSPLLPLLTHPPSSLLLLPLLSPSPPGHVQADRGSDWRLEEELFTSFAFHATHTYWAISVKAYLLSCKRGQLPGGVDTHHYSGTIVQSSKFLSTNAVLVFYSARMFVYLYRSWTVHKIIIGISDTKVDAKTVGGANNIIVSVKSYTV